MGKTTNDYIAIYKEQLQKGDIQVAYERLLKYLMSLKSFFEHKLSPEYNFGNICRGYLDYTYFPFFNDYLRAHKLRFGIVLNHQKMRFELWLMGQNAQVQKEYWELLKDTEWNRGRVAKPKYSVLEAVLVESPDFDDTDALSTRIEKIAMDEVAKIISFLNEN